MESWNELVEMRSQYGHTKLGQSIREYIRIFTSNPSKAEKLKISKKKILTRAEDLQDRPI